LSYPNPTELKRLWSLVEELKYAQTYAHMTNDDAIMTGKSLYADSATRDM
jgi:hypothetical protein